MGAKCAHPSGARVMSYSAGRAGHASPSGDSAERPYLECGSSGGAQATTDIFNMAAAIEPDPAVVSQWYHTTSIATLDGLTAEALVALNRAEEVMAFLRAILDHGD